MADRIPIGGTDQAYVADWAGNILPDHVLDVRDLGTGQLITDLQPGTPTYVYDGAAFPPGQARADKYGFYGFTVPAGTGTVQVRVAAQGGKDAGPWLIAAGQTVPHTVIDAGIDRAVTAGKVLTPAAASAEFAAKSAPTLTALTPAAVFGPDLQPAMSTWALTGGATYQASPEQVTTGAGAGSISFPVTVTAGRIVQVDLLGSFTGGSSYTVALGSDAKTHAWSDANRSLTFVAASSGQVTVTVSWASLTATLTGVRTREVTAQPSPALKAGDGEVRAVGANIAVGQSAQYSLTTGSYNNAIGQSAQRSLTTGSNNNAIGQSAQRSLTTGSNNNAIGYAAQYSLTTGSNNNAIGYFAQYAPLGNAAYATTTGSRQTSVGHETGQNTATQLDDITTIGYRATAGANKGTALGAQSRADHTGSVALGSDTTTTATGQVMVGPRDVEITDTTKGVVLRSPNGTRYRVTVTDTGTITATAVL